jgi:hypothetical protein
VQRDGRRAHASANAARSTPPAGPRAPADARVARTYNAPQSMSSISSCCPSTRHGATEWAYALTPTAARCTTTARRPPPCCRCRAAPAPKWWPWCRCRPWPGTASRCPRASAAGTPRLRAALEGLLEEQLLDDPDAVHLALQPGARAGEPAWVATCDRAWLRNALQALEAAGRPVSRIVPEFAPEGDPALVCAGRPRAAAGGRQQRRRRARPAAGPPPCPCCRRAARRHAAVAEPAVAALAEQVLQHKLTLQQAPQRWLQAARTRWDLAQFDFASSGRARA